MQSSALPDALARRMVLLSGFIAFIIFGIRLSFAVFFAEFVAVEGWSNEAAASIFSISMLVFAFGSTPAGILLDRFGPRVVFTSGVLLLATGLFLSSQAQSITHLAITYGIVGGSGLAIIGLGPLAANISEWIPPTQRGRAIGVAFAGTGLGSLLFVPLVTSLIAWVGWRGAYVVLGLICLLILAPMLALLLRKPPTSEIKASTTNQSNWKNLFRKPLFWILLLVSLMALGPLRSLSVHQVAYIESVGVSRQTAANYVGLAGFLTATTFIGWGIVSDKFGRATAFTLGAFCLMGAVAMLVMLQNQQNTFLLFAYAVLLALGEGTRSSQTTALASDIFQDSGLGLVNGIVGAMFGFGAAFGPWIVGRLRDSTGSYMPGFVVVIIMTIISIVGVLFLSWSHQRKITT